MRPDLLIGKTEDFIKKTTEGVGDAISFGQKKSKELFDNVFNKETITQAPGNVLSGSRQLAHQVVDLPWRVLETKARALQGVTININSYVRKKKSPATDDTYPGMPESHILKRDEVLSAASQERSMTAELLDKLPHYQGDTEKGFKAVLKRDFLFRPYLYDYIDKTKLHAIGPKYNAEENTKTQSPGIFGGRAGGWFDGDVWVRDDHSNTFAHELLHQMFQDGLTEAAYDPARFNREWDEYIDSLYYKEKVYRTDGKDVYSYREKENPNFGPEAYFIANEMMDIDSNIKHSGLYNDHFAAGGVKNDYNLANERFAYLGVLLSKPNVAYDVPDNIYNYYKNIIVKKMPKAPYRSFFEEDEMAIAARSVEQNRSRLIQNSLERWKSMQPKGEGSPDEQKFEAPKTLIQPTNK